MNGSDSDARLMLAFREGDDSALAFLYARWAAPLLRFLTRLVSEPAVAEELMQETFVRVHGARERYVHEARFSTWLFRIARNLALNELDRARNKFPHRSQDEHEPESPARPRIELVAGGVPSDELVDQRREHKRLEAELALLPERQRSALWLGTVEGYSYAEIAEVLDTTPQSVKALVHRARANLADRMGRDAEGRGSRGNEVAFGRSGEGDREGNGADEQEDAG